MLTPDELQALISELAGRPGHEKVRTLLHRLLVAGLGADSRDIDFEKPAPEVHGRIDALLGRTVFELKSDLRRERQDAEEGLARYLAAREAATRERYTGIATDGAEWVAFFRRGDGLVEVGAHRTDLKAPRELVAWLQASVAVGEDLLPDAHTITREFGRDSLTARRALDELDALWADLGRTPEAQLKRALWRRLLSLAYGTEIGDDRLFLQHTYLVIIAKAVAWAAIIDTPPAKASALLHGTRLAAIGISGQSEPDFFDWVLAGGGGDALVMRIMRQVNRFRLNEIRTDILKALYESLIDPETRHDLGEYYTPDWLAARMVATAVTDPLRQRVMDPACGSGTFLFHAVRAVLDAAAEASLSPGEAARRAAERVAGIDVHPVAVIFARVTCLLALMPVLRQEHPGRVNLPVYLGDALQWNLARVGEKGKQIDLIAGEETLEIFVPAVTLPADPPERPNIVRLAAASLRFPAAVAANATLFYDMLDAMIDYARHSAQTRIFDTWLTRRVSIETGDRCMLVDTYRLMRRLHGEGRNHIWGYVARNLARPVWLSSERQKADVVIGNPPWVAYRHMSAEFQARFREESHAAGLWIGGKVATQQDLSSYFFLRAALLYMRREGRIALVMPHAALSRRAYENFRRAEAARHGEVAFRLRFTAAWAFGPEVWPLFPVPSCVLFAETHDQPVSAPLPEVVMAFAGTLPRRNAATSEANANLTGSVAPWPTIAADRSGSPYRRRFRNGATLVPRRLVLVEPLPPAAGLPPNPVVPTVRGRIGNHDKRPWTGIQPPCGQIERQFLRPVLLGETAAPFRLLEPVLAVIPWDDEHSELMDSRKAYRHTWRHLYKWLEGVEATWDKHKRSRLSFREQCDYYGKLSKQFPISPVRVVYAASGTNPAACIVRDSVSIAEHALYWSPVESIDEAQYLCGILNSMTLRDRVEQYQARGQWGARHFDKYVFNLPIPRFDEGASLHRRIAEAAREAERVAGAVPLREDEYFTRTRRRIRAALAESGIAARLDGLVAALLHGV